METSASEVPLTIPAQLKAVLEDDCFWIARRNRLVRLPRTPSVEAILQQYYHHCIVRDTEEIHLPLLSEVLDGIKIYFDFILGGHLLYPAEQQQWHEWQKRLGLGPGPASGPASPAPRESTAMLHVVNGDSLTCDGLGSRSAGSKPSRVAPALPPASCKPAMASSVYGAEHLLRLFVRLPTFLSHTHLPSSHLLTLHLYTKDLLGYLCSQRHQLFSDEYYFEPSTEREATPTGSLTPAHA